MREIQEAIEELLEIKNTIACDVNTSITLFQKWSDKLRLLLDETEISEVAKIQLYQILMFQKNPFSKIENEANLKEIIDRAVSFLNLLIDRSKVGNEENTKNETRFSQEIEELLKIKSTIDHDLNTSIRLFQKWSDSFKFYLPRIEISGIEKMKLSKALNFQKNPFSQLENRVEFKESIDIVVDFLSRFTEIVNANTEEMKHQQEPHHEVNIDELMEHYDEALTELARHENGDFKEREKQALEKLLKDNVDVELLFFKYLLDKEITAEKTGDFAKEYTTLTSMQQWDFAKYLKDYYNCNMFLWGDFLEGVDVPLDEFRKTLK